MDTSFSSSRWCRVSGLRGEVHYDDCLCAAFDALPSDRLLERSDADHAFRCALARTPDLGALALAVHAVRAAGLLRGYDIRVGDDGAGVLFEDLLTADRLAQLSRLVSPTSAAAGVLAGMGGSTILGGGSWVGVGGTWQLVASQAAPLLRAWLSAGGDANRLPVGAPPRPRDTRHGQLWRTPSPTWLRVDCELIECRALRRVGDPAMGWTRPPRARKWADGRARSPSIG